MVEQCLILQDRLASLLSSWSDILRHREVVLFAVGLMSDPTPLVDHVYQMWINDKLEQGGNKEDLRHLSHITKSNKLPRLKVLDFESSSLNEKAIKLVVQHLKSGDVPVKYPSYSLPDVTGHVSNGGSAFMTLQQLLS